MSETLKKLEAIGAQKIYEDTHIPIEHITAILDEDYSGLTRIQYQGFISILEREYNVDLSDAKVAALEYFNVNVTTEPIADDAIFTVSTKSKNLKILYIAFTFIAFFIAFFYFSSGSDEEVLPEYNETTQESVVQKPIEDGNRSNIATDLNESIVEKNSTVGTTQVLQVQKPQIIALEPIKILPRSRVWLGYIDVETNKKKQKTFVDEFDLDGNGEWLMIFGHGYVTVVVNGEEHKFSDKNTLRLHYKDAILEQITAEEFKRLNRGRKW